MRTRLKPILKSGHNQSEDGDPIDFLCPDKYFDFNLTRLLPLQTASFLISNSSSPLNNSPSVNEPGINAFVY